MSNDINLWVQSKLSANDYNKLSSVENVWLSNGSRYIRIPGSYADARKIYYKNENGELFGIGNISSDENSYTQDDTYVDYFAYTILNSAAIDCVLYVDKVENGVEKTVCVLPSSKINDDVYTASSWASVYTIDSGTITYSGGLAECLNTLFTIGKVELNTSSLNIPPADEYSKAYSLLYSWNLGEWNTGFEYSNSGVQDGVSQILPSVSKLAFVEITTDYIPNIFYLNDDSYLEYFDMFYNNYNQDLAAKLTPSFRTRSAHAHNGYAGYPVIGELKDTLDYVLHADNTVYPFSFENGICPFLHQPLLLTNRVGNKVTIVHAPDIVAYSVIDFGDGSAPVTIYTNPKSYETELSGFDININDYLKDNRTFESILYRERDYRGEHTYRDNGTYVISVDMYYFGAQIEEESSTSNGSTRIYRIHATKTIVIDNDEQDLIYFKIPKEIPHLYVNGYRCPIVSTDDESNTVALNVTGYDFETYAQIAYDLCEELTANVDYTNLSHVDLNEHGFTEDWYNSASHYAVYSTTNILALTKNSFRVSVCELDDVRDSTVSLQHVCKNDRVALTTANEFASMLDVFGESCAPIDEYSYPDSISLIGPQCIGHTYDLRNLMDWSHLYMNYYPELMEAAEEG